MKINIQTKNLNLTANIRFYIEKRISGLKKYAQILKDKDRLLKGVKERSEIFVEVEKETTHHRKGQVFTTKALLRLPQKNLVAKAKGEDLGKTITEVKNELKREIRKYKLKKIDLPRRKARKTTG